VKSVIHSQVWKPDSQVLESKNAGFGIENGRLFGFLSSGKSESPSLRSPVGLIRRQCSKRWQSTFKECIHPKWRSSAVAKRSRDTSCLSV